MDRCKYCNTIIAWAKQMEWGQLGEQMGWIEVAGAKANPIELAPHPDGNLVLSPDRRHYRFAQKHELGKGKNAYRSHFAVESCRQAAKDERIMLDKRKKRDRSMEILNGGMKLPHQMKGESAR